MPCARASRAGVIGLSWSRDAETAAERFRESPVDAVIFDTDGQGAESIEAFLDMHETAHRRGATASRRGLARAPAGCAQEKASRGRQSDRSLQANQDEAGPGRTRPALAAGLVSDGHEDARCRRHVQRQPGHLLGTHRWCCTDGTAQRPIARKPGPSRSSAARFRAGRGKTIATRATTTAMRPGHFTRRRERASRVPASLAETTRWLSRPADWDHNGGEAHLTTSGWPAWCSRRASRPPSPPLDQRSVDAGASRRDARARSGRRWILAARGRGGDRLAGDLWPPAGDIAGTRFPGFGRRHGSAPPSPAPTAGFEARRFSRSPTPRCACWPRGTTPPRPTPATGKASISCARGQSDDGGWGPRTSSPPEPFDTALALLALARCEQSPEDSRHDRTRPGVSPAQQQEDGSWIETTRPAGNVSYAQRISTTGWATLALLATREPSVRGHGRSETVARPSCS